MGGNGGFIILISFYCLFTVSCSHKRVVDSVKTGKADELCQRAIFQFLAQDKYLPIEIGKGLIKVDPLLYSRDTTIFMDKVCFDDALYTEQLQYPVSGRTAHLIIPDSRMVLFLGYRPTPAVLPEEEPIPWFYPIISIPCCLTAWSGKMSS